MDDIKQQILSKTELSSLIGQVSSLERRGNFATGLCPFHEEKTPSFYVYDDHYHCYGCGAHGDAISFVRKTQGLSFMEALRVLGDKVGISTSSPEEEQKLLQERKKKSRENLILQTAKDFFRQQITEVQAGTQARDYVQKRGISEALSAELSLGYAPAQPDALYQTLKRHGFTVTELEACSLINRGGSRIYDFFQNRLVLPIRDEQGRLIAFTGRALGDEQPKYKNSRFDKGSFLFGLDRAREAIRQKGRVMIVEGHLDALQMWQHGFSETVACQGTALTHEHLRKLSLLSKQIIVIFDADAAGVKAALKTLDNAFAFSELFFRVVLLPAGEDPDSLLKKTNGTELMANAIEKAEDLLDFAIKETLNKAPQTGIPDIIANVVIPWLDQIADPLRRAVCAQKITQLTGIASSLLTRARPIGREVKSTISPAPKIAATSVPTQNQVVLALSPLEKEFIGHLYFANIIPSDFVDIKTIFNEHLQLQGSWLAFTEELWACVQNNESPRDKDPNSWQTGHLAEIINLIQELSQKKTAFQRSGEIPPFVKLRLEYKKKLLKETLDSLKQESIALKMRKDADPHLWNLLTNSLIRTTKELESLDSLLRNPAKINAAASEKS